MQGRMLDTAGLVDFVVGCIMEQEKYNTSVGKIIS
jgi:hypothetical protein